MPVARPFWHLLGGRWHPEQTHGRELIEPSEPCDHALAGTITGTVGLRRAVSRMPATVRTSTACGGLPSASPKTITQQRRHSNRLCSPTADFPSHVTCSAPTTLS